MEMMLTKGDNVLMDTPAYPGTLAILKVLVLLRMFVIKDATRTLKASSRFHSPGLLILVFSL